MSGLGREIGVQRIMIVEDSATMRSLLASTLEGLGAAIEICEAESGFEALRCLPRDAFDLIVTDMAVIEVTPHGLVLKETAPGVSVEQVRQATEAELEVAEPLGTMTVA